MSLDARGERIQKRMQRILEKQGKADSYTLGDVQEAAALAEKMERRNEATRARHEAYTSCGLKRVRGAMGGIYYE